MDLPGDDFGKLLIALATYLFGRWQKGWEVAHSDLKDRVDETCKLIDKIADDASGYYSRDRTPADELVERRIKSDFLHLERLRLHCAEDGPSFDAEKLKIQHSLFYEVVTDGDFESVSRIANLYRADRIRSFASALAMASRDARRTERSSFLPRFVRRFWGWLCWVFKRNG